MDRLKRLFCSLSLALACAVGFLSVGSISAYAYSIPGDWFLPYSRLELRNGFQWETHPNADEFVELSPDRFVNMDNPAVTADGGITWIVKNNSYDSTQDITYILTVRSWNETTLANFSFFPESLSLGYTNHDLSVTWFSVEDVHFFHRDAYNSDEFFGYSVVFTVPANQSNSFSRISLSGSGTWPKLGVSLYAYYSDDTSSSAVDLATILSKLEDIEQSSNEIKDTIENQFSGNPGDSFDVGGVSGDVNQKLGVLNFTSDVMIGFLDLFSSTNATTELTFPGFSMSVGDERTVYQIWPDYTFDLQEIEERFPFLINTLRMITVLSVWLALLRYLGKRYEHFINNR